MNCRYSGCLKEHATTKCKDRCKAHV